MSTNTLLILLPKRVRSFSMQQLVARANVLITRIHHARMIARQRQALSRLNSSQLKDIGISRDDAVAESSRSFWDIPERLK